MLVAGHDEASHAVVLVVGAPEVAPVGGALQVAAVEVGAAEGLCHLCQAVVAVGVLYGAGAGAGCAVGDVAQAVVEGEAPAAVLLVVGARVGFGVVDHGLQGEGVVDGCGEGVDGGCGCHGPSEAFEEGVGDDDFGVAATLCAAVAVAAACVGHVALVFVDVEQGADDVGLSLGFEDGEQGCRGAVGVPDGVVVVVVGGGGPAGVLAGLVDGHEHGVVEGGVEHAALGDVGGGDVNAGEAGLPVGAEQLQLAVEGGGVEVAAGLVGADVGDADAEGDEGVGEVQAGGAAVGSGRGGGGGDVDGVDGGGEGLVGVEGEVDGVGVAVVPAATDGGGAGEQMGGDGGERRGHELLALAEVRRGGLAEEMGGVNKEGGGGGGGIMQAVVGATGRGGNLSADAAGEGGGVIAEGDGLRETDGGNNGRGGGVAKIGHDEDVAVLLAAASAADVGLREAGDGLGHGCPASIGQDTAVGAWLHHAEGCAGPGEGAAYAYAADAGVYVLPVLGVEWQGEQQENQQQKGL